MLWGRVVRTSGRCPSGVQLFPGQAFTVVNGRIDPPLCAHVRESILREVAATRQRGELLDGPARYRDSEHEVQFELYDSPVALHEAA